jgi:hypothetical protein
MGQIQRERVLPTYILILIVSKQSVTDNKSKYNLGMLAAFHFRIFFSLQTPVQVHEGPNTQ